MPKIYEIRIESNNKEYLENMKDEKDCLEIWKKERNDKEYLEYMKDRK